MPASNTDIAAMLIDRTYAGVVTFVAELALV
jgi:hypothetical protein